MNKILKISTLTLVLAIGFVAIYYYVLNNKNSKTNAEIVINFKDEIYLQNSNDLFINNDFSALQDFYFQISKKTKTFTQSQPIRKKIEDIFVRENIKFEIRSVFETADVRNLYSRIKIRQNVEPLNCEIIRLESYLEITICLVSRNVIDDIANDLRTALANVATVEVTTQQTSTSPLPGGNSVAPLTCTDISSSELSPYQIEMQIDPTFTGSNANMVIIENNSTTAADFAHCEFNTRFGNGGIGSTLQRIRVASGDSYHSIQTLGILISDRQMKFGSSSTSDCFGIVPELNIKKIFSFGNEVNCSSGGQTIKVADMTTPRRNAILKGVAEASYGDILLIEFALEGGTKPAEVDNFIFKLIKLATNCLEVIVIEPAGNSSTGVPFDIDSALLGDSGAIIVGATADLSGVKIKHSQSNFGSRVDCYAKGDGVLTPTKLNTGDMSGYLSFPKTSCATAIIAGVVAGIQSKLIENGRYLKPLEIREAIRNADGISVSGHSKKVPYASSIYTNAESFHSTVSN
jgi:hypothetical protein